MTNTVSRGRDPYFNWLYDLISIEEEGSNCFRELAFALYSKEFYSFIPNDDNRVSEGLKLREVFASEFPASRIGCKSQKSCSILEMLVGLCTRIEDHIIGEGSQEEMRKWFWSIIQNLELMHFTDNIFRAWPDAPAKVDEILTIFLSREYSSYGKGGLFPLRRSTNDQREIEIWQQFNEYYVENSSRFAP